jgi:YrbI family 3-deoxy-D-manno-octulosonate 8-phosphate phosphatase
LNIVIIPVRGGSKGIKRKNLAKVNGITLIERAIRTSLKAKVDHIIVTTDDLEIKNLVKNYEVIIHERSEQTSTDESTTESVLLEVIKDLGTNWSPETIIGLVQATSPFISTELLDNCLTKATEGFSAFSAFDFHGFIWEKNLNWDPVSHPADFRPRRQTLNPRVMESGAVYAFPLNKFIEKKYRFCSEPFPIMIPKKYAIEIDEPEDLLMANLIATQYEISVSNNYKELVQPKIIITDFDGCLTDDSVILTKFGIEKVKVNRKDGLAVKRIKKLGIDVLIATSEKNSVVDRRAAKMGVRILKGLDNKAQAISNFLEENSLAWDQVWYIGNDVNDLETMSKAKISFCPIDASPEIFKIATIVLTRKGGEGVLAEIATRLENNEY